MALRYRNALLMLILPIVAFLIDSGIGMAQDQLPELNHQPADVRLLQNYLERLGYTKARPFRDENIEGLAFIIKDTHTEEIIKFSTLLNPNDRMLKFECHDLATVPQDPDQLALLFQKLTQLNGVRTVGKYYVNPNTGTIQFFYFKSVLGGLCFADFERTIRLIEYIIFNDIKYIRQIVSS